MSHSIALRPTMAAIVSLMLGACTPSVEQPDQPSKADPAPELASDAAQRVEPETSAEPSEQAAALVALAREAERRGLGDEAAEHVRRAHALHPTIFTEKWLAGERDCDFEILANGGSLASIETWRSSTARLAKHAEERLRDPPKSEAAARRYLCDDDRCEGPGPWIVGLADPGNVDLEHLAVVMPRPDGTLATLADGWYSNAIWECNHKNRLAAVRIAEQEPWVHVRVERGNGVGEWHSCSAEGQPDTCIEYCREATAYTYDWLLDPDTSSTLAVITRRKKAGSWEGREDIDEIADASEVGGAVDLVVDGRTIEVIGCGKKARLQL